MTPKAIAILVAFISQLNGQLTSNIALQQVEWLISKRVASTNFTAATKRKNFISFSATTMNFTGWIQPTKTTYW